MSLYTKIKDLAIARCPFCGSPGSYTREGPPWWVTCDECDADGPMTNESGEKAVELWNKRATS